VASDRLPGNTPGNATACGVPFDPMRTLQA
jgi:hypothetical protein